ncbi:MAG: ribonuclease H-like domain-containing protein [Candidatus Pacebacteria bacterium]|nr:ribonuclease H-like domain-containing protein [Candidatus Paceibacterota bacterium]
MRAITFDIETKAASMVRGKFDTSAMEVTVVGIHDSETNEYSAFFVEEFTKLWPILERADMLIGFNSDSFDIPILNRYYPGDLTKIKSLDLLTEVYNVLGRRVRLDTLAQATLGRGKTGDGLKAVDWWEQGLFDQVKEYCLEDVKLTRELYDYARTNGNLKYKDLREVREMKIDASDWENGGSSPSLTHTLPF